MEFICLNFVCALFFKFQMHTTIRTSHKDHNRKTMARIQVHMLNNHHHNNSQAHILTKLKAIHMHQTGHRSKFRIAIDWQSTEAQKTPEIIIADSFFFLRSNNKYSQYICYDHLFLLMNGSN